VFTTCSSYFDYPRSATRCSLQFVLLHQVHNASFFLLQSLAQELFQCTVLPLGISFFRVCATASSPLVHFSLHIFLIPCSVVHRFLTLLLHSSVDSLSVCCSVRLTRTHFSGLIPTLDISSVFIGARQASVFLLRFPRGVWIRVSSFGCRDFSSPSRVDQLCLTRTVTRTVFPFVFSVKASAASAVTHS
jgi:hypothetical protein